MGRIRKSQETMQLGTKRDDQKVWRVAAYIRLSKEDLKSADEDRDQSESVINQKKIIIEYLERYFDGQYVIVDFYIDDGLTGTDDTRENFMRMVFDIERNLVDCVICKTLARIFRNYSDQGYYLEEVFLKKNIRFISIGDPSLDTYKNPDALTGLEVPITGIMNDRYAAKTSNDVRRTFATKRRKGEFIGSFAPYGYKKDPLDKNHFLLDEEPYRWKRKMRDWIINESMSYAGVAKRLNELGVPNPAEYKRLMGFKYQNPCAKNNDGLWSGLSVKRVLFDPVNLGHMVQGKQRVVSYKVHDVVSVPEEEWVCVENMHEPTFTQEEYDELLSVKRRDTRTPNGEPKVHLFSGFMRCADCQKAMSRSSSKNFEYYACRTYRDKSKERCTKHSIPVVILEPAVLASIQMQISLVEKLAETLDKVNQRPVVRAQTATIETLLKARCQERNNLRKASDSLYVDWKAQVLTTEEYQRMKADFGSKIMALDVVIENLEEEQRIASNGETTDNPLFATFLQFRNINKLDRRVLIALVDTIFVHENRQITIKFNYADQYKRVMAFIEANEDAQEVV